MSAMGELLREIMPSWLSPPPRKRWSARRAAMRQAGDVADENPRGSAGQRPPPDRGPRERPAGSDGPY